jgi:hypothetical protein
MLDALSGLRPEGWTGIVIGACLGAMLAAVPWFVRTIYFIFARWFGGKSAIEGDWYKYHWTVYPDGPRLVLARMHIRRGFTAGFKAECQHITPEAPVYNGTAWRESGHVIVRVQNRKHQETIFYRFRDPVGVAASEIHGIWLSYDFTHTILAGGCLLSAREIDDHSLSEKLKSGFELSLGRPLLRIRPTVTPAARKKGQSAP